MVIFTLFAMAFFMCAPIGAWCCLFGYRFVRGKSRKEREREAAIDDLLSGGGGGDEEDVGIPYLKNNRVTKRRIGPQGHVLLPTE